jgi:hypothetical protein
LMTEGPLFGKPLPYQEAHYRTNFTFPGETEFHRRR